MCNSPTVSHTTCVTSPVMRRFGILVMAAVLGTAGVASAESGRVASQPAKAARAKPPVTKPAPPMRPLRR